MSWLIFLPNLGMGASTGVGVTQTFRQALYAKLASISEVSAIVGSAIYPGWLPQTHDLARDGPALTYEIPTDPHGQVLGGSDGTSSAHVKLRGWSYDLSETDPLMLALFNALNGAPGEWGNGTCAIMSVTHQDSSDEDVPPRAGTDLWQPTIVDEYLIRYRIPLPTLS